MNIEQLRYLLVVSKNKSLSKSSEQLHISHQGLSNAIRALEKEFGFQILHRMNKGVALTEKGKLLVEETEKYLTFIDSLKDTPRKVYPSDYTILCSFGSMYSITPKIISFIYKNFPQTKSHILEKSTEECIEEIQSGMNNLAIISMTYIDDICLSGNLDKNLVFTPLLSLKLKAFVHSQHALSRFKQLSLRNLKDYPIILEYPLEHKEYSTERILEKIILPSHLIYENNRLIVEEMLKDNLGIYLYPCNEENNITPSFINNAEIQAVSIKDNAIVMIGLLHKKTIDFDPLSDELVLYLKNTFR